MTTGKTEALKAPSRPTDNAPLRAKKHAAIERWLHRPLHRSAQAPRWFG